MPVSVWAVHTQSHPQDTQSVCLSDEQKIEQVQIGAAGDQEGIVTI